jgi:hypothetical protein
MRKEQGQPARFVLSSRVSRGRRDRPHSGAACPLVRLVSGVGDHSMGDRPRPDPVGETARLSVTPAPTAVLRLCLALRGCYDTPYSRWPCPSSTGPSASASCGSRALRRSPGLPPPRRGPRPRRSRALGRRAPGGAPQPGRRCGTCTVDLDAVADWLLAGGVTTVALASTGVSGLPLCALLAARGVPVLRIDPRPAQRVPGRPTTARLDGQWRQRLQTDGRLAGAFRPADQGCVLRGSWRHRPMRRTYAAQHMQPRHQA